MCQEIRLPRLVNRLRTLLENEILHAGVGELLARLAEQHHEHHPLDLIDVDVRRFQRQQAVYQYRASMEALERVARQTERLTRDAYLGVITEISRVQALRQAVQSSETALQATEAGFEVGTRTTVDVLVSQNTLSRAQTNFARSRYDYILNVLRLKQAAGSLSVDDIDEVNDWLE